MDKGKNLYGSLVGIFTKLSFQQRLLIGGLAIGSLIFIGFIFFVFNEPSYSTLYTNINQEDASQVIQYLRQEKIPYKITANGTTISVPKEKVYEVRLALAGKGIPSSGIIGYEIFDKNIIGMSEFVQKMNYKRALEGEIARTIMQQSKIKAARVHIVIPEKTIFKSEEKSPSASVVLKLKGSASLTNDNITAIANLVAHSIEGLNPNNVTIIDSKGRMLSKAVDQSPLSVNGQKQFEIKSSIENYLTNKAQQILDKVVGYGNSDVQINVDLNFKQIERTLEAFDPESQVAISEQTSRSQSNGVSVSDSNAIVSENVTTNYEVSKTIEKVIEGAGNIKRITVAAVINGVRKEVKVGDKVEIVNEPRSEEQLKKLEMLIGKAVGLDNTRKDQISIVSIPFETPNEDEFKDEGGFLNDNMQMMVNYILLIVAIAGAGFVLKNLLKKLKEEKIIIGRLPYQDNAFGDLAPSAAGTAGGIGPPTFQPSAAKKKKFLEIGDLEDEISDEAAHRQMKQEKIVNYVAKNPSEAAKLINSWLREDEYE